MNNINSEDIRYKLYMVTSNENGYGIIDRDLTLNGLYFLLKKISKEKFKRFLISQQINDSECAIFVGYNKNDINTFMEDAFIPFVRPRKVKEKKKY